VTAAIRILCESSPSFATSIVNGLLAWATVLGGFTALGSGLPVAMFAFVRVGAEERTDLITKGMGLGFLLGMSTGNLMCIVFIARLVT
jgi:hypothetical protein